MTEEEKKIHDLKFEIRQLRLRVEDDEMVIKKLMNELENANKCLIDIMIGNAISFQDLNRIVDDVKKLKEEKK